mgnify:FL=1
MHHRHNHHLDSDVNWYGDGDGDSYWVMVASKIGALGKGYPARTPLNLRSKCQHLLSTYNKVLSFFLSFFLAFLPTQKTVLMYAYHKCMCVQIWHGLTKNLSIDLWMYECMNGCVCCGCVHVCMVVCRYWWGCMYVYMYVCMYVGGRV